MAKKTFKKPVSVAAQEQQPAVAESKSMLQDLKFPAWLYEFKIQAIIVAVLAFVCYINTVPNESAHDDTMVIVQNEYTLEGFAGIPDIFTKDAYDSYYKQFNSGNQLAGGRYRPLSIVTFAIEQQFFGAVPKEKMDSFLNHPMIFGRKDPQEEKFNHQMHIRHFFNVVWFALCVVILLYFLRFIVFRNNYIMALIATILFTVHPIHTEVVANVKSRDEIMSLIFMCLTMIYAFRFQEDKERKTLIWSLAWFFLAFLSKEYAITLLVLFPLALMLFNKVSFQKSFMATLPFIGLTALYIFMRLQIVGKASEDSATEILNNPYYFAKDGQKLPTEIATALNYIKLLIWPYPLSADYSYNTIPYKDFSNPLVLLSLLVHGGLIASLIILFKKALAQLKWKAATSKLDFGIRDKSLAPSASSGQDYIGILCFAIAFYLLHLLMICNIVFDIGATMGERLIFHSSVGFCIAVAFFLYKGMEMIKPEAVGKAVLAGVMIIIIALGCYGTILRNPDWKNDYTLFIHDLNVVPNSVLVNANVAAALIDHADFEKDSVHREADVYEGIRLLNKAIELHPTYVASYLNRALAYFKLQKPDSEVVNLDKVSAMFPNHPKLPEMYYNVGVMFYVNKQYAKAAYAWKMTLKLKPGYATAQNALSVLVKQGLVNNEISPAIPQQKQELINNEKSPTIQQPK